MNALSTRSASRVPATASRRRCATAWELRWRSRPVAAAAGGRAGAGAHTQRLLWASTGTKDPAAPATLFIEALAAPETVDTNPEKTLAAFADHGKVGPPMPADGDNADAAVAECRRAGVGDVALAALLQREGAAVIRNSRHALSGGLQDRREACTPANAP